MQVDSSFSETMEKKRDHAWSLGTISYVDSYDEFNRLYLEYAEIPPY